MILPSYWSATFLSPISSPLLQRMTIDFSMYSRELIFLRDHITLMQWPLYIFLCAVNSEHIPEISPVSRCLCYLNRYFWNCLFQVEHTLASLSFSSLSIVCLLSRTTLTSLSAPKDERCKTHPLCLKHRILFECVRKHTQVTLALTDVFYWNTCWRHRRSQGETNQSCKRVIDLVTRVIHSLQI